MSVLSLVLSLVLGLLSIPVTFILLEVLNAVRPGRVRNSTGNPGARPGVVVLVPAHDEEKVLAHALNAIRVQLQPSDRMVVVADNCSDSTAEVARRCGATVVERRDPLRPGKGYALDAGARFLEADPREAVIVIDADCVPEEGAIDSLARAMAAANAPVQGAYLMTAPAGSQGETHLREALVLLKNFVRPLGLYRLGLPCLLTGSGMALPWTLFREAPLASGNRVDDMQLSVDLAIAGSTPRFCPEALVTSAFPSEPRASRLQRSGWLDGHLRTLFGQVPRLARAAWIQRRLDLGFLALELSVPPLSVLVLVWIFASTLAIGLCWGKAFCLPLGFVIYGSAALLLAGVVFWIRFGRDRVPAKALFVIPLFFWRAITIAFATAFTRPKPWVRTSR